MTEAAVTFHGIGNFDGKKRIGGHAHNEVPNREDPRVLDRKGNPTNRFLIDVDGPFAQLACRLHCRDGHWPGWFVWAVGWPVPRRFQQEAARLAMRIGTGQPLPPLFRQVERPAAAKAAPRGKTMTRLPPHVCVGGVVVLATCGPVLADMSITCTTRRQFVVEGEALRIIDEDGCGKKFVLDKHGNRVED